MKRVLVVPDGGADFPIATLGGKTPLAAAETPHMDSIATRGGVGRVQLTPSGLTAGTDVCHLNLFGYPPQQYLSGRAALEAFSIGLTPSPSDAIVRINLVTIEDSRLKHFAASYIPSQEARPLIDAISKPLACVGSIHFVDRFHHVLVIPGAGDDIIGTKTYPPHQHIGEVASLFAPKGELSSRLRDAIDIAQPILQNHPINRGRVTRGQLPANSIWPWAEGRVSPIPSFKDLYGQTAAILTAVPALKGIAGMVGISIESAPGMTASLDTNYESTGLQAVTLLDSYDIVIVHIDSPDEASHLGDTVAKCDSLSAIDSYIVGPLLSRLHELDQPWQLTVVPDHYTLLSTMGHAPDPVPFASCGSCAQFQGSKALHFNEEIANSSPLWNINAFRKLIFGAPGLPQART